MNRLLLGLAALLVAALMLAGCGDGGTSGSSTAASGALLSLEDSSTVAYFNTFVAAAVAAGGSSTDALAESTDEVIAIAKKDPDALYRPDADPAVTMREVLSDAARQLEPYEPEVAAKLDDAAAELPN